MMAIDIEAHAEYLAITLYESMLSPSATPWASLEPCEWDRWRRAASAVVRAASQVATPAPVAAPAPVPPLQGAEAVAWMTPSGSSSITKSQKANLLLADEVRGPDAGFGKYLIEKHTEPLYAAPLHAVGGQSPTVDQAMDEAIAAGDGTLHGAIDYWQERALRAEAARKEAAGEQEMTDEQIAEVAARLEASDPTDSFWREFARAILAESPARAIPAQPAEQVGELREGLGQIAVRVMDNPTMLKCCRLIDDVLASLDPPASAEASEAINRLLACMDLAGWGNDESAVYARKVLASPAPQQPASAQEQADAVRYRKLLGYYLDKGEFPRWPQVGGAHHPFDMHQMDAWIDASIPSVAAQGETK